KLRRAVRSHRFHERRERRGAELGKDYLDGDNVPTDSARDQILVLILSLAKIRCRADLCSRSRGVGAKRRQYPSVVEFRRRQRQRIVSGRNIGETQVLSGRQRG